MNQEFESNSVKSKQESEKSSFCYDVAEEYVFVNNKEPTPEKRPPKIATDMDFEIQND